MSEITTDTVQGPDGAWRYRIYVAGTLRLISGGFQLQTDAARCGAHIASDVPILLDFLKASA